MSAKAAHAALAVVALALLGWAVAAAAGAFARQVDFRDVEGAWEFDGPAYAALIAGRSGAEALRGAGYRFRADAYVRVTAAGEQEVACTYERTSTDTLTIRPRAEASAAARHLPLGSTGSGLPEASAPFQLVLDPARTRLAIRTASIPLPFRRPEPQP